MISNGIEPRPAKRTKGLQLPRRGGRPWTLVDAAGTLTQTGEFYFSALDPGAAQLGKPDWQGNSELIRLAGGGQALLRTFDPVKLEYNFTEAGKSTTGMGRIATQ